MLLVRISESKRAIGPLIFFFRIQFSKLCQKNFHDTLHWLVIPCEEWVGTTLQMNGWNGVK